MKIAIAAGGTGGHIYPALTLAKALKERGHSIVFFGSSDSMEKDVVPENGFEFVPLNVLSTQGNIIHKVVSLLSIIKSYFYCKKMLKGYDLAIGFGNYISIPVIFSTLSYTFLTSSYFSYKSFPIPIVCTPCPGNKNPIFICLFSLLLFFQIYYKIL